MAGMDPYPHIKARYPGGVGDLARAWTTLPVERVYRVANDLHWLITEVGRLRAERQTRSGDVPGDQEVPAVPGQEDDDL